MRGIDPILQVVERGFGCHYERRPDEKNTLSDGAKLLSPAAPGIRSGLAGHLDKDEYAAF
jgi:hypothetical protein